MAVMPFCILSAQTGNPQSAYSLEFVNTDSVKAGGVLPSNHFWLVNRSSGKRTQVKLPDMAYVSAGEFLAENVIKVKSARSMVEWSKGGDSLYLFIVTQDTGRFLYNHKNARHSFKNAGIALTCFIEADKNLFDSKGNFLSSSYWLSNYGHVYEVQCMDCKEIADWRSYFTLDCKKLRFTKQGATRVHVMKQLLVHMWGDSLFAFDIPGDKQLGGYPTVPLEVRNVFYKSGYSPTYDKILDNENFFPVRLGADSWTYLDETGKEAMKPFQAHLAFPFMFNKNLAPVNLHGAWGIINKEGTMTYPFQFDSISIGSGQSTTYFYRHDSTFIMSPDGRMQYSRKSKSPTQVSTNPVRSIESTCLVYIFMSEDEQRKAYILVNLSYDPAKVDHAKMVNWVSSAIKSEQAAMWERGLSSYGTSFNNPYSAELMYVGKGCYGLENEYRQKSSWVTVFSKSFLD
ncbi:MAG: hypothetical protein KAY96_00090 [Bacteroidia bacterium]|nr:hypothetical protein [Bacteroidota bacterium]MBP8073150.1 hypothetical protein [Bacteroidia bacterium]